MSVHTAQMERHHSTEAAVEVLVFKTNIRLQRDARQVALLLDTCPGLIRWNIDRQDTDHVLRVESKNLAAAEIISRIEQAGYTCEELPD